MVEIYKQRFTSLQNEILSFLFVKAGKTFNQRQLALNLGVSNTAIMKSISSLQKEGLIMISKEKESGRMSISLNRDNARVIGWKRAENLRFIYSSGIIEFLEDVFSGGDIILFGSYSLGEDLFNSDIDIAVIGRKEKEVNLDKYEKILDRKIVLQFYPSLSEIHKNLRENILRGIVLKGGIKL